MKRFPCLIVGVALGAIVGCNAFRGYHHGTEAEAFNAMRILYGGGIGLLAGLFADMVLSLRRS